MWSADAYPAAWRFAAEVHHGQKFPDTELPYILHVGQVAMEVMAAIAARGGIEQADLAVKCALLHDTVEDTAKNNTPVTTEMLRQRFGDAVADGVDALTKDQSLPNKSERMRDSLKRIQQQPPAVWMVKLADRITNLQPPPKRWSKEKIDRYREEAQVIHDALAPGCPVLGPRLAAKIDAYPPDSIG